MREQLTLTEGLGKLRARIAPAICAQIALLVARKRARNALQSCARAMTPHTEPAERDHDDFLSLP